MAKFRGSAEERRALSAYVKLARAAAAAEGRINAHLSDYGLTLSQFGVLEALYHLGPLYQHELATKILKSSGNMTLVIDNLCKRGLVERRRDEVDRRYICVHLTPEGSALIENMFPKHVKGVVATFGVLSAEEQMQLADLCRKLGLGQNSS
ncbi:MarR family transcriptional regulator [soil metagenome]